MTKPAKLALEDGTVFTGTSFGAAGEVDGEVCFNTSMTGYQEILTDPSYRGQIVTMTYTEMGNYGVNARRRRKRQAPPGRLHRQGIRRAAQQFPLGGIARRLSQAARHRRPGRHRHAGPRPPPAHRAGR